MTEYYVDLSDIPTSLRRVVKSWYIWRAMWLRAYRTYPGDERDLGSWYSERERFWRARPPTVTNTGELEFYDHDISYYLVPKDGCYYIDQQERSSRGTHCVLRNFEDVERYLLFLIANHLRPGYHAGSPAYRWVKAGLSPVVSVRERDPINEPGIVTLTVDHEPVERGSMDMHSAIIFSHFVMLTYEQLDAALRVGIRSEWFMDSIVTGDEMNVAIIAAIGGSKIPGVDKREVHKIFGEETGDILTAKILDLVREAVNMPLVWKDMTPEEGVRDILSRFHDRHPELSPEAIYEIGRCVGWNLR